MRKLVVFLMVFLLLLTGCNGPEDKKGEPIDKSQEKNSATVDRQDPKTIEDDEKDGEEGEELGYVFEINDIKIAMHAEAEPILAKLGEPMDEFEADSCAFQGKERVYTYSGFEVHTYEKDKKDYIASVLFIDDSISTKEGVYLYSDIEKALEIYGDDYIKEDNSYKYRSGKSEFVLLFEDDEIVSIEYVATAD